MLVKMIKKAGKFCELFGINRECLEMFMTRIKGNFADEMEIRIGDVVSENFFFILNWTDPVKSTYERNLDKEDDE